MCQVSIFQQSNYLNMRKNPFKYQNYRKSSFLGIILNNYIQKSEIIHKVIIKSVV